MKGAIDHPHLLGHSELGLLDPTLKESNDNNNVIIVTLNCTELRWISQCLTQHKYLVVVLSAPKMFIPSCVCILYVGLQFACVSVDRHDHFFFFLECTSSHVNAFTTYICWCLSCTCKLVCICSFAANMYASALAHVLACVFLAIPFKCAVYVLAGDACTVFVDVNCCGVMLSCQTQLCVHTSICTRKNR